MEEDEAMPKIRGRIIRVLDAETVVVNLGKRDGVSRGSVFSVLSEPEAVLDPGTREQLGRVQLVKAKVRAAGVYDRFTIALTKWVVPKTNLDQKKVLGTGNPDAPQGGVLIDSKQIQPWRATSEIPIRLGDEVEANVADRVEEETDPGEGSGGPAKSSEDGVWDYDIGKS